MKYTVMSKDGRKQLTVEAKDRQEAVSKINTMLSPTAKAISTMYILFVEAEGSDYNGLIEKKNQKEMEIERFLNQKIQEFQEETGLGVKDVTVETMVLNQLQENRKVKVDDVKITPNLEGLES